MKLGVYRICFTFHKKGVRIIKYRNCMNGGQKNLGLCEKACQIASAPNDNFSMYFGLIPSSPHSPKQCRGQKKHSFPPIVLEIEL